MRTKRKQPGVTLRAMIITMILVPLNHYWVTTGEMHMGGGGYMLPSFVVPFYNVIFSLFVIVVLNFLLKRFLGTTGLGQGELLSIYILLSSACALSSLLMMTILIESLGHPFWFATPENEWKQLFIPYIPKWLSVQDTGILRGYYEGESTLYKLERIKAWFTPALIWSAFITVLVFVMFCINVIVRRQWSEKERLSYPIARLPFEMASTRDSLFRSKLTWIGFAIAGTITLINGLSFLYPTIPQIPVNRRNIDYLFTEKPFSAMRTGGFSISFYPFALGLSFLMPLDLTFSCWFFYLMGKIELVVGSMAGWNSSGGFPYNEDRAFGATVSLVIFLIWIGRRHLKDVILKALGKSGIDDSSEAMSYRSAVLGIILGLGFLTLFAARIGMSVWMAASMFAIYFTISIMVTRMRAELGFFTHPMWGMMAKDTLIKLTGTRMPGNQNLTILALFNWFNEGCPSHPMPHQIEALRLAERAGIDSRRLGRAIIFITAFAALSVFWVHLHIFYKVGALSRGGWALSAAQKAFHPLQSWITYPRNTNFTSILFMGLGFAFSAFLSVMRIRFIWWVFHPIGYIVANLRWAMLNFWNCMLISSVAKWLILKYGGSRAYRKAVRVSLGLVLGNFVIGALWNVIGILSNKLTYSFWP